MSPQLISFLRNLLTAVGGLLIGNSYFHGSLVLDSATIEGLIGGLMSVIGTWMSIRDKTVTIEMLQGTIRHLASTLGGIVVASGKISAEQLTVWVGALISLIPLLQGWTSRKKVQQIQSGQIDPSKLKS